MTLFAGFGHMHMLGRQMSMSVTYPDGRTQDLVKIDEEFRPTGDFEFVTISLDDVSEIRGSVPQFLAEMRATDEAQWLRQHLPYRSSDSE